MRLIQFRILVLILFFFQFYQEAFAQNLKSISYCRLFDSIRYNEKTVKTTAVLYIPAEGKLRVDGDSDEFLFLDECNNRDHFAKTNFSKTKNLSLIKKKLLQISNKNSTTLYFVTFTGEFKLSFIPAYGHLGGLRAEFRVDNIDFINSIKSKYALPNYGSKAPILEISKSLKDTNTELLFSFFGRGFSDYDLKNLLSRDAKLVFNDKLIDNNDFFELSKNKKDGELMVFVDKVTKNKNEWSFQGNITIVNNDKTKKTFKYENMYLVEKNKERKLTYSKIWEVPKT
jgi:hypothetical protein